MDKQYIVNLLEKNDNAVLRALVVLYDRQTTEEQVTKTTKDSNGRGFNARDAGILSSFAKQHLSGFRLTPKQMFYARKYLKKYAGQLLMVAEQKAMDAQMDRMTGGNQ